MHEEPNFLNSCLIFKFFCFIYVFQVIRNIGFNDTKQITQLRLCKPYGFVFKTHVKPNGFIRLIHDNLIFCFVCHSNSIP